MNKNFITFAVALFLSPSLVSASDADHVLHFSSATTNWEKGGLPIGNGSLGGVLFGGVDRAEMQFNVDSLWTGNENAKGGYNKTGKGDVFGAYQNFGSLVFEQSYSKEGKPKDYGRQLDISKALYTAQWKNGGVSYTREAIASHPDQVIVWRIFADKPGMISGVVKLEGAHEGMETVKAKSNVIQLRGELPNKLEYEARVRVLAKGGSVKADGSAVKVTGATELLIFLTADTNYVMDRKLGWMKGDPADKVAPRLAKVGKKSWDHLLKAHIADYASFYDRVKLDLGKTESKLASKPINERIKNYKDNAKDLPRASLDPELEAMLFNYGRYLLISSSREGTLPANLQGIWCNTNSPAWCSDFHTNINLEMNYWLAETTNLPELAKPLFDMLSAGVPVYKEHSQKQYKVDKGFVTRMSLNPFGGGGWNWNIEGTAWLSQHFWEHYQFSNDKTFLKKTAWPWMRDVSEFWIPRLKERPDGSLVVPNAWSHEHGPHEDGTAHAQQLMFDLFTSTLKAAEILNTDQNLQKRLKKTLSKLYGPKIGSWGQLMEWMGEKPDLEKSHHRHTSHLFAVHPGNQITFANHPDLMKGAVVSLTKRGEVGDSRRSWTWAWRTALWSRMGEAERAHGCVAGMLAHNTLENLWTTHPPFQIDGNLGISAGMAEMFLQSHAGEISILPALPKVYATGSVKGLRARGDVIVDISWKDGKFASASLMSKRDQSVKVRVLGEDAPRELKLKAGKPTVVSHR